MSTSEDAYLLRDMTRDLLLAGRRWRKIARAAAAEHGMTEAASAPLLWIDRLGDNVRQNALADAVGIEGASLVRLIDELQKLGLVTRTPDPSDRRANVITLTAEGHTVVGEVNLALQHLRQKVFAGISLSDLNAARRIFAAIEAAATAIPTAGDPQQTT